MSIVGRRGDSSSVLKEEALTMDPRAPQFNTQDMDITMHNVTLRAVKNERFLQVGTGFCFAEVSLFRRGVPVILFT